MITSKKRKKDKETGVGVGVDKETGGKERQFTSPCRVMHSVDVFPPFNFVTLYFNYGTFLFLALSRFPPNMSHFLS